LTAAKLAYGVEPSSRRYRLRLARYRFQSEVLAEKFPDGAPLVLDAGCGTGRLPRYWRHASGGSNGPRILGAEISTRRLERARESGYGLLAQCDLSRPWPFRSESFDAVVCEQVLEHFDDVEVHIVLSERVRVLKPEGLALIGTPTFTRLEVWTAPLWTRLNGIVRSLRGNGSSSHHQHLSRPGLAALVRAHGLVPLQARGHRVFSLPRAWLEDFEWYYRFQQWLTRRAPWLSREVTLVAVRTSSSAEAAIHRPIKRSSPSEAESPCGAPLSM
jgi:SAM-dependent methyltransferase